MLIRKNTKVFKTILEIMKSCQDRPDRDKFIRLYITKAGHSINERISVEGIQGDAALFYEMNYYAALSNMESSNRQLHESDDFPGLYFFHSPSNKAWDETPFEFDEAIKKEFASLTDLPTTRKREKAEKFLLPALKTKTETSAIKKEKSAPKKVEKVVEKGPKQPDYKLKHKIQFTNLEKVVFKKPQLTRKDVFDYYSRISDYILPYLRDRPLSIRLHSKDGRNTEYKTLYTLPENVEVPTWVQNSAKGKKSEGVMICNDKDHLLFFAEIGCVGFDCYHSRAKSPDLPDYIVIEIESPDTELGKAVKVALTAGEILSGLQLPSFVKTFGHSCLHIYVPLDSKSTFETTRAVAEYICKLIRLKVGDVVILKGSDGDTYGKVMLDYHLNEYGKSVVAPYSLVPGESPTVATPILWEEVTEDLQLEHYNHETIFKRLKQVGDPFEMLLKKRVNADTVLESMEAHYAFLF